MESPAVAEITSVVTDDMTWTDSELLARLEPHQGRLLRFARVLVGDPNDADDLLGEAIVRILPRWRQGKVDDPVAYVRRILVNLASRRRRRLSVAGRRDHAALEWLTDAKDVQDAVSDHALTLSAVMSLPIRRRAIVVLRFYEDMSLYQIASVLGIAEGTVKSQLSRALDQLRQELNEGE